MPSEFSTRATTSAVAQYRIRVAIRWSPMGRRWLVVVAVLLALLCAGGVSPLPVITASVTPNATSSGETGGMVTVDGSGFGAHDSVWVGVVDVVDVPDLQGSIAGRQQAGARLAPDDPDGARLIRSLAGSIPSWPELDGHVTDNTNKDIDRILADA